MALQDILAKIGAQAEGEAAAIRVSGRRAADDKTGEWLARAREEAGGIGRRTDLEIQRLTRQREAEARLKAKMSILALKRAWLDKVTARARRRLLEQDSGLYRSFLASSLARHLDGEATEVVFAGDAVAREVAGSIARDAGRKFPRLKVAVADEGQEPFGGLIIRKGPLAINLSLAGLLEETAGRHQADIHRLLFPESHD